ncbi:hypothetical protein ACFYX8_09070 [Streptomyces cyaneofuscatus]|uniref:hypothetical protein n=1 Tax=Streptomyces TaxID=1883 RepID=UPI001EF0AA31|nr:MULTISPECIES: hypothetical protein [unclassified Streptomyces]
MRSTSLFPALLVGVAMVALSSCIPPNAPITYSGFRMEGAGLLVAMPLCPGETVESAEIVVPRKDKKESGFETLWSAREPRTAEARGGVFQVNGPDSFARVTKELSGTLPDEFYVDTRQVRDGKEVNGSGYVDLTELDSAELRDDEFITHKGKVMTRDEINAQAYCGGKK